ncbi:MAG: MotA/TolQ/ExbB proton channel family protein [Candidatus Brocadiae bacterium]|nr:MotA/TolQ/ExbB proton channel family protein [Candidatus Brocadiia bacterium]
MENFFKDFLHNLFFKDQLTFLDFLIIGFGIALLVYQILKRITTFSKSFYRKAQKDRLHLHRTEVKMNYLSSLIELLPILGLLGTVWGLKNALSVIALVPNPTIKQIATEIAPALSTTFWGLLFAILNLVIFHYLHAYFSELIEWCKQNLEENKNEKA